MELIIKPTSRCNFNCNFCSAGLLKIKTITRVPSELKQVLFTIKPNNLIITGGDPLMMPPSYYEELLTLGDWNISFTTNLKDFYLNLLNGQHYLKITVLEFVHLFNMVLVDYGIKILLTQKLNL